MHRIEQRMPPEEEEEQPDKPSIKVLKKQNLIAKQLGLALKQKTRALEARIEKGSGFVNFNFSSPVTGVSIRKTNPLSITNVKAGKIFDQAAKEAEALEMDEYQSVLTINPSPTHSRKSRLDLVTKQLFTSEHSKPEISKS